MLQVAGVAQVKAAPETSLSIETLPVLFIVIDGLLGLLSPGNRDPYDIVPVMLKPLNVLISVKLFGLNASPVAAAASVAFTQPSQYSAEYVPASVGSAWNWTLKLQVAVQLFPAQPLKLQLAF